MSELPDESQQVRLAEADDSGLSGFAPLASEWRPVLHGDVLLIAAGVRGVGLCQLGTPLPQTANSGPELARPAPQVRYLLPEVPGQVIDVLPVPEERACVVIIRHAEDGLRTEMLRW